ncbi:unnamed protein product [Zymoseptoria tritici ST99CH_3D1]|nr:unnamed protein product [Zymoseptoria tritici ST99CH_3D1]
MLPYFFLLLAASASLVNASPAVHGAEQYRQGVVDLPLGYASLNGGMHGGQGGRVTIVSDLTALTNAAADPNPHIIYVNGTISGAAMVRVASYTTILGFENSSQLIGIGLAITNVNNVIVRNLAISRVRASTGDAISIQYAKNVWIDHMDLSSDLDHDKDHYDGLLDITHASNWVTVSNTYFHDHYKASLIGHSDSNSAEDQGHLHVTYYNNHFSNIYSRIPSIRFGTVHIFNSYYDGGDTAVNARMGAQVLVESSVFAGVKDPVTSENSKLKGGAVVNGCDLGGKASKAQKGNLKTVPYGYNRLRSGEVRDAVVGVAGNTLKLG